MNDKELKRVRELNTALLALLTEDIGVVVAPRDFATDLEDIADMVEFGGFLSTAAGLRAKAKAIRAGVGAANEVAER